MRVALVVMPFASEDGPALGPSLLQSALDATGHPCDLFYENLRFAARIGLSAYRAIDANPSFMTGEWLFAEALHGAGLPAPTDYANDILALDEEGLKRLIALRGRAALFVEETTTRLVAANPEVVAFSATFQQTLPSLAVARRIKETRPATRIVLGGADCSGPAAARLIERFDFLDAVIAGEAEDIFPRLLARWEAGEKTVELAGVHQQGAPAREIPEATVDPESSPIPKYDDFFAQLAESGLPLAPSETHLRLETTRGCAWGEKRACAFCGLNGETIHHRAKTRDRISRELAAMERYPARSILVTDNLIDRSPLRELMRESPEKTRPFRWFVEASARLDESDLRELADAGVRRIQPGIESLSSGTLRRLRKGTTATQGILFLRRALEQNIALTWNLLCGDPGETGEELELQATLLPLLHHLPPPLGLFEVEIHRFSPYFEDSAGWGWGAIEPIPAYRHLHPFPDQALRDLAYFFRPKARPRGGGERAALANAVRDWRFAASRGAALLHHDDGATIRILDRRHGESRLEFTGATRRRFLEIAAGTAATGRRDESLDPETEHLVAEGIVIRPDRQPVHLSLPAEGDDPETALALAAELASARLRALAAEGAATG